MTTNECRQQRKNLHEEEEEGEHGSILRLLRADPLTAAEVFGEVGGVLSALVVKEADLKTIQTACRISPRSLSQVGDTGWLPLHHACLRASSASKVVDFFAHEYPDALTVRDDDGCLPIHLAIMDRRRKAPFSVIKTLVDLVPETLVVQNEDGISPLTAALLNNYSQEILQYIFQRVPKTFTDFRIDFHVDLTAIHVRGILHLLPQLIHFECYSLTPVSDGIQLLMESLENNKSIKTLALNLTRAAFESESASKALENMLANNQSIESFIFHGEGDSNDSTSIRQAHDDKSFLALHKGFSRRAVRCKQTERLLLYRFSLSSNHLFCDFLYDGSAPRKTSAHDIELAGAWVKRSIGNQGRVEELTLDGCDFGLDWPHILMSELSSMKTLQILTFGRNFTVRTKPITQALAKLLTDGTLRSFSMNDGSPEIDPVPIYKALSNNKLLEEYNVKSTDDEQHQACLAQVLKHHNTTLKWVYPGYVSSRRHPNRWQQMIAYFTMLNRYYRQMARNPDISLNDFLELLLCIPGDGIPPLETPEEKNSIQFGLLRESPGLWS